MSRSYLANNTSEKLKTLTEEVEEYYIVLALEVSESSAFQTHFVMRNDGVQRLPMPVGVK
jgi:hypothetical protein